MDVLLALLPILTLIVLMGVFKVPGDRSSLTTLIVTIVIAVWYFGQPLQQTGLSFFYGALKALVPILLIILMAIYSYNVLLHTGKIEVLKAQFSSETSLDVMKVAPAVVAQLAVTMILVPIVIAQLTVPGKKALPRNT